MQENIKINVNVADNGTTDKANKNAEQLRATLKSAAAAAESIRVPNATAAAREGVARSQAASQSSSQPKSAAYKAASGPGNTASDTNLSRGIGGMTGASGRDFAAQAQGLGGLVHVYATFAANLFAVSAAFGALSKAMDLSNMVKGLDQLGATSGRSLGGLAKQMVLVADGAISMRDAMNSTALASAGGLSNANILRMTEVAKKASLALGRDLPDSMDRLTKGIVKTQPELLDELGIMARVIPAQQEYARQLGKSASSLTEFEKKQAFANAVLAEGERKFGAIELDANPYSKILASMSNLMQTGLELINKVLSPVLALLSTSPTALAIAMAGIGAILLKQAIPAFGMFREQAQRMQTETTARIKQQISEQQIAAGLSDNIARRSAENKFRTEVEGTEKLKNVTKIGSRIDESVVGKDVKGILKKSPFDMTKVEQEHIEFEHMALQQKISDNAASDAEKSASRVLGKRIKANKELLDEQAAAGDAAEEQRVKDSQRFYSHETLRAKQLEKLKKSEAKAGVLANAAGNADVMGPVYAWRMLNEETNKLDAGKGSKALTKLQGGFSILTSAVGNLINVYGIWAMVGAAVYAAFDKYMSTNAKEMEALSQASSQLDSALDNVDNTIKAIAANKDPLQFISVEVLNARSNALQTVVDQMATYSQKTKEAIDAQSGWDKVKNVIKSSVGGSLEQEAAGALAKSISSAFKIAAEGPEREKAAAEIKKLLDIKVDPSSLDALTIAINASNYAEHADKLHKIVKDMSHDMSNLGSNVKKLNDDFNSASKAFDTVITDSLPTDNVAKLGFEMIKLAQDFDKALEKPASSISEIVKTSGDMSRLKLMDPEFATTLIEGNAELTKMATRYGALTKEIKDATNKQAEFDGQIVKLKSLYNANSLTGEIDDSGYKVKLEEIKKLKLNLSQSTSRKVDEQKQIETTLKPLLKQFADQQYDVLARGSNLVSVSLENSLAKGAIALSKVHAEGLAGTREGLRVNAELDKKSIQIDIDQLTASQRLITSTDNLRIVQEKVLLEQMKGRLLTVDLKDKPELEADIKALTQDIKAQEVLKKADFKTLTAIVGSKNAEGIKVPTEQAVRWGAVKAQVVATPNPKLASLAQTAAINKPATEITSSANTKSAASKLLPKAEAEAGKKNAIDLKKLEEKGVEERRVVADRALEYAAKKDILDVDIAKLSVGKANLDIAAKSAIYVNQEIVSGQIANENSKARLEYNKSDLDFQRRIIDAKGNKKAVEEITDAQTRNTAKYNEAVSAKAIMDAEKLTTAEKGRLDLNQKIFDIRLAIANIQDNTKLTIEENKLNLAKELNIFNSEELAVQENLLAVSKEQQRSKEAIAALESAKVFEFNDYSKKVKDLGGKNATGASELSKLYTANIDKLNAQITAEKELKDNKIIILEIQKDINIANGKLADKVKTAEYDKAIQQNIFEITQQSLDLNGQKLEGAKQLNTISAEFYDIKKKEFDLTRAQVQYDNEIVSLTKDIAIAEERVTNAKNASVAYLTRIGNVKTDESTKLTEAELAAKRALDLLKSRETRLVKGLELQKQSIEDQASLNTEITRTNRLLKEQGIEQQNLENNNRVLLVRLDLDKQRIDNARALGYLSEEESIRLNEKVSSDKLDIQYANDKLSLANELTNALEHQKRIAADTKLADDFLNSIGADGVPTRAAPPRAAPDKKAIDDANKAVKDVKNKQENLELTLITQKLLTKEGSEQLQKIQEQNQLLKDQAYAVQKLENSNKILNAQLDLDKQRLDNAKALNSISEETYIRQSTLNTLSKAATQYADEKLKITQAITIAENAQRDLNKQGTDAKTFNDAIIPGSGVAAKVVPDKKAYDTVDKDLAMAREKDTVLDSVYQKQTKGTLESEKQLLVLQKQNDLLKAQETLAASLTTAFGDMGTAMGEFVKAQIAGVKAQKDLAEQKQIELELLKKPVTKGYSPEEMAQWTKYHSDKDAIDKKYAQKSLEEELRTTGLKAKSAKGFFDKKGDMYKVLGGIEKAQAVMTGILEAKKLAESIATDGLLIASKIPAIFANFMAFIPAPFGIPAAAAAIATFIGAAAGGGGGAPEKPQTYDEFKTSKGNDTGAGGMGGDPTAMNTGLKDSLNTLTSLASPQLEYTSQMTKYLQSIDNSMQNILLSGGFGGGVGLPGSTSQITSLLKVEQGNEYAGVASNIKGSDFQKTMTSMTFGLIPKLDTAVASIFLGTDNVSKSLAGYGAKIEDQTLAQAASSNLLISRYDDITTTIEHEQSWLEKAGNFLTFNSTDNTTSSSTARNYSAIGSSPQELAFKKALQDTYLNIKNTFQTAGNILKVDMSGLDSFRLTLKEIDLSSGTDAEKLARLQGAIGKQSDAIAERLIPTISDFRSGSDSSTTAFLKLASAQESASAFTDSLNIKMIDYNNIANKRGNLEQQLVAQSLAAYEKGSGLGKIVSNFTGSTADLESLYLSLRDIRTSFVALGYDGELVNQGLLKGAGGLQNLTSAISTYQDRFLTAAEKQKISTAKLSEAWKPLTSQLTALGYNIPKTKDDFKSLVQSLEAGGAGSSELLGRVLLLADGMDKASSATAEYTSKSLSQIKKMYELQGRGDMARAISRQEELNAMDALSRPMQEYLYALEDEVALKGKLQTAYDKLKGALTNTITSLKSGIDSLQKYKTGLQLGANSNLTPQQAYAAAKGQLDSITAAAQQKLDSSATEEQIANRNKAVAALPGAIDSFLAQSKTSFASGAQYQADFASVNTLLDTTSSALDTQKTDAELQLDQATKSNNYLSSVADNTKTIADLMSEFLTAQSDYTKGIGRTDMEKPASLTTDISNAITSLGSLNTSGVTSVADSRGFAKPYADGGIASGLSIVGEEGPELADFRNPARIYTASQTSMLGDNAALVSELKALRDEVASLRSEQKEQTGQIIISNYDANKKNADVVASTTESVAKMQDWKERSKVVLS